MTICRPEGSYSEQVSTCSKSAYCSIFQELCDGSTVDLCSFSGHGVSFSRNKQFAIRNGSNASSIGSAERYPEQLLVSTASHNSFAVPHQQEQLMLYLLCPQFSPMQHIFGAASLMASVCIQSSLAQDRWCCQVMSCSCCVAMSTNSSAISQTALQHLHKQSLLVCGLQQLYHHSTCSTLLVGSKEPHCAQTSAVHNCTRTIISVGYPS